jgi:SAM-dependent methyltransferase
LAVVTDRLIRGLRSEAHLPPLWLRDIGPGNFEATGREFLDLFIRLADLQPEEQVLDIGCGSGRMAMPLAAYLSPKGSYVGVDIVQEAINWCQENIAARYPNFHFLHVDLYNQRYNPAGHYQASNYTFPFELQQFDFIFLTSVFTHMLPDELGNYLGEIRRLLRPHGRCLATFFLLNEAQQLLADQKRNDIDFKYGVGQLYRVRDQNLPESAVAYEESFVRRLIEQSGLVLSKPIQYGTWSGRPDGLSYQDILLVRPSG